MRPWGSQARPSPWLHLVSLFMNSMNRIGDKWEPFRSSTCTENKLDFVPRMQTQLLPFKATLAPHTLAASPQNALRNMFLSFLQIHKTYVNWRSKLTWTPYQLRKGEDLVHCSMTWTKAILCLLNSRVQHSVGASLPTPWNKQSLRRQDAWSHNSWNTHSGPPS